MSAWTNMSRRERAGLVAAGVVALYAFAAALFFMGRRDAWEKSRKAYAREAKIYAQQRALIGARATWQQRDAEVDEKMPKVDEAEDSTTRWQRVLERIAAAHSVYLVGEQPKPEEEHGGVWEMPIEVRYEASLERLVQFLFALENAEDAMFDVRDIDITSKNTGYLSGKFTLTCAYMKGQFDDEN